MANQQENQQGNHATMKFQLKTVSGLAGVQDSCEHLAWLSSDLARIPHPNTPCGRCNHPWENWLCLCCKVVLCGRFVNQHMLQHHQQTQHCLALGFGDLSVWCYSCEAFLNVQLIPQLRSLYENANKLRLGESTEDNQADGCESKEGNHREGKRRRRRRRKKKGSMEEESTKKSNETSEKMYNEGAEGTLGAMLSSSASESNENDIKFNYKQCLCGQEATIKISQSEKDKNKMYYSCKENKCDFFELCFDSESLIADTILPKIQAALQNQIVELVGVAELKAEVRSLTSRINIMESNIGLMKMMILMNLFYGLMLMVVVIAVLFKL